MNMARKIAILGILLLPFIGSAAAQDRKISDHFDGKKFYNPTLRKQFSPGFSDIIDMAKQGRVKWPTSVKNQASPNLKAALGSEGIAITFINHATFLIQLPGINILTDPVWSTRASPLNWAGPKRVREPGVQMDELPKIDLIVISHNHYDHLDIKTLKELNARFAPKVLVPVGDKALIESIGIKNVQELDWWEHANIGTDTKITFTPAQHSSARTLFDKDKSLWGSYFIQHRSRSVFFGGDGGYSTQFADIKNRLGSPEIALLGIGSYAPRSFMKAIHMDPTEAVVAHKDLGAKLSIGMHYGTFQLSSEGFDQPQEDLKKALEKASLPHDTFITLQEGETMIDTIIPVNLIANKESPI